MSTDVFYTNQNNSDKEDLKFVHSLVLLWEKGDAVTNCLGPRRVWVYIFYLIEFSEQWDWSAE